MSQGFMTHVSHDTMSYPCDLYVASPKYTCIIMKNLYLSIKAPKTGKIKTYTHTYKVKNSSLSFQTCNST